MPSDPAAPERRSRRIVWPAAAAVFAALAFAGYARIPLLRIHHAPAVFARRSGAFSANVTGSVASFAGGGDYSLNGGPWRPVGQGLPRAVPPEFTIELPVPLLRPGPNRLVVRARALLRPGFERAIAFTYDPSPIRLPLHRTWDRGDLDVQDGRWERIDSGGEWRVRPVATAVDYDRILVVTGAFAGGRRVRTSLTLRRALGDRPFGFGVLPLWGGHPDDGPARPRRGWRYAIAWYYSRPGGVGSELAEKVGARPARWIQTYRDFVPDLGRRYHLRVDCTLETGPDGRRTGWTQRLAWWADGDPEPAQPLVLRARAFDPLPEGEFGVALVAHRCQVEFGPVDVERIGTRLR